MKISFNGGSIEFTEKDSLTYEEIAMMAGLPKPEIKWTTKTGGGDVGLYDTLYLVEDMSITAIEPQTV